jgi:hypothetical protein
VARKTRADAVMAIVPSWIERHCVVPDGFLTGRPFRLYEWQLSYVAAFYAVRGSVELDPVRPILGPAFRYQRGLIVGPQKLGKDPLGAAHMCVEAVGPVLFAGWAGRDDGYACADHGCRCGWEYAYDPGEPMGMSWPTPLIQITAVSEDQTDNAYDALRPMIDLGPLHDLIPKTGEQFIRLPNGGRIEPVTSSAPSRLGQRITFAKQGEAGLYTKRNGMEKVADTQYRNLAGMGGRASLDSNAWDPAEKSVAQREYEAKAVDIYRQFAQPPAHLSYANKAERRKIHRAVYPAETRRENGGHIDLDGIESEAAKMAEHDEAQAARFFGNRLVAGAGKAFDLDRWIDQLAVKRPKVVPDGALVTLGFDGSRRLDHTALIGTEVASGYQWPLGIWRADEHHGEIPAALVDDVVDRLSRRGMSGGCTPIRPTGRTRSPGGPASTARNASSSGGRTARRTMAYASAPGTARSSPVTCRIARRRTRGARSSPSTSATPSAKRPATATTRARCGSSRRTRRTRARRSTPSRPPSCRGRHALTRSRLAR